MIIRSAFRPAWWLPGPHLQTLYPSLFRPPQPPPVERQQLELPDGDFLHLDWTRPQPGPLVLVLHGLEGSIQSHYAAGILGALAGAGLQAVLMHFRGCSGEPNRLLRSYHSGETGDIGYVVEQLVACDPQRPIVVIGYSLGGNALLKWLGETGDKAPVATAIAVSVPFDLSRAAARLDAGLSRIYQRHLINKLHRSVRAKAACMDYPVSSRELARLRSFRIFDDRLTAPIHGFRNADHYYQESSCGQYLQGIERPTLILHSRDDPFLPARAIPTESQLSPSVTLELSDHGGHVGFVDGTPAKPGFWLERRICAHLREWFAAEQ